MKRYILTTAALAFAAVLGATTTVDAAPHGGGHAVSHGHVAAHAHVAVHPAPSHAHHALIIHGHSVNVPIHVRGYNGWAWRCWFPGYRTYGYYCGADQAWYYWYAPLNEYLPISYMSIYPPVAVVPVGVPVGVPVPTSVALPPGATFVPGPITAP